MRITRTVLAATAVVILLTLGIMVTRSMRGQAAVRRLANPAGSQPVISANDFDHAIRQNWLHMFNEGKHTFRYETFGDEAWWGDTLHLHQAIEGAKLGGVSPVHNPMIEGQTQV
jgi:hypothetical protein